MGIWKKMAGAVFAALVLLGLGFAAGQASAAPKKKAYQPIDAKVLIAACWEISKERRDSGNTSAMRQGTAETIGCLEDEIVRNGVALFKDKDRQEKNMRDYLEKIRLGVQKLYWDIYNNHLGCKPSCGTMYTVFHLGSHSGLLGEILTDIIMQRNEYKL